LWLILWNDLDAAELIDQTVLSQPEKFGLRAGHIVDSYWWIADPGSHMSWSKYLTGRAKFVASITAGVERTLAGSGLSLAQAVDLHQALADSARRMGEAVEAMEQGAADPDLIEQAQRLADTLRCLAERCALSVQRLRAEAPPPTQPAFLHVMPTSSADAREIRRAG